MSAAFRRLGPSELLPRYIFVEGLFVRRRVLEVGAVASTSGESARFLLQRGAREVVACDGDLEAVQDAQRRLGQEHLCYRAALFEDLEPAGFDVVLVADLAPYVRAPPLLGELVRRVARGGWLVGALRNPAGLALSQVMDPEQGDAPPTYGQLLDALTPHLQCIEVATQSLVLGYQLAFDSAEGLEVDGTLAREVEAAWFIIFAGAEPVRPFEPTWVQLPPEPLAFSSGKLEEATERLRAWEERGHELKSALEGARAEVDARQAEIVQLAAGLDSARQEKEEASVMAERAREQEAILREWLEVAEAAGRGASEKMQQDRRAAADLSERLAVAQATEARVREEVEAGQRALAALGEQLARAQASEMMLQGEVATLGEKVAAADASDATIREEREAQRAAVAKLKEQLGAAQASDATLREELQAAKQDAESARRSERTLDEELTSICEQVERATRRESGLAQQVAERDAQLELLRRQLNAQEMEIVSLRRAVGRSATPRVQQIYERAAAELQAVKVDLFKRTTSAVNPPNASPIGTPGATVVMPQAKTPLAEARPPPPPDASVREDDRSVPVGTEERSSDVEEGPSSPSPKRR